MNKYSLILLLLAFSWFNVHACRFTVREIGFSVLSQDIYTLAVIDENADPNDIYWEKFHKKNRDCNVRLEILNPLTDQEHPVVINATKNKITFPVTVLVAPDYRLFEFKEKDIQQIFDELLDSPLRSKLRKEFPQTFATVFWIEGKDQSKNNLVKQKINQECLAIENIMPSMPKIVKKGPVAYFISKELAKSEKLLLWSLGIQSVPEEPVAFVLYGRGRIIGDVLSTAQIMAGGLYKYMSMIGADCECGLDKKWMLGNQIPLLWAEESRQELANLVGFDVDNPMILAEMSRILAKENTSDVSGSVAFAPESIDLDKAFGNSGEVNNTGQVNVPENKSRKILISTSLFLLLVIAGVGTFLLYKK